MMTGREKNRSTKSYGGSSRRLWLALFSLLSWLGCYSPLSSGYACLRCDSRCPEGFVCRDERCLPACQGEGSCADGATCVDGVCQPLSGEPLCPVSTLAFNACVGRPVDEPVMSASPVVLESNLPEGIEFDPASGQLSGTPMRESAGAISVRDGALGGLETTIDVTAIHCANITTTRIEWCAGEQQSAELRATDARDYEWRTSGLPEDVQQYGAALVGVVERPGTYPIAVQLVGGNFIRAEATIDLVVAYCSMSSPPPDAGTKPDGDTPLAPLRIETTDLGEICAGQSYVSDPLRASGGTASYQWSLDGSSDFSIDAATGVVSATSPASGQVELAVRVTDAESEDTASVTLNVLPANDANCSVDPLGPRIETTALPSACVGTEYRPLPLVAAGGSGDYQWSLPAGPAWLSIDSENRLIGTPEGPEALQVLIRVEDGEGAASQRTFDLVVFGASSEACGRTPIELVTSELPDACLGEPYLQTLSATGGSGNYLWIARPELPLPPGLTLQNDGVIRGTPSGGVSPGVHQFTIQITSGLNDPRAIVTLSLRVTSCGALVFVGDDAGVNRLYLTRRPYTTSRELSEGLVASGESVKSFLMSSATPTLAFLIDTPTSASPARLYVADAATGQVNAVEWPQSLGTNPSVIDYVWSADGSYLGVVVRTLEQTTLAIVSGETGTVSSNTSIAPYLSDLFSINQQLCYLATGDARQNDILCNDVVDTLVSVTSHREGTFLIPLIEGAQFIAGDQSYLAILPAGGGQGHYRNLVSDLTFPTIDHVFSSTLNWAAGLDFDGEAIELIRSELDVISEEPVVLAPLPGCDEVLAWSKDERTLVCQGGSELLVFKLDPDGSARRAFLVAESSGRPIREARRVISSDGRWLAFDSGSELRLVDTDADVPTSTLVLDHPQASPYTELEIDSATSRLFYHRGNQLYTIPFQGTRPQLASGSVLLSAPLPCTLLYLDDPDRWCGAARLPATFFPAPAGDEVAFLDTSRQLHITATSDAPSLPRQPSHLPVKCTRPDGEVRCDEHVAWAPAE